VCFGAGGIRSNRPHMLVSLSENDLARLPHEVRAPRYDRSGVGQGLVHIGVGGFFRAHQAMYADQLLEQGEDPSWGYCGIGLLPHDARLRDALRAQDWLYAVLARSAQGDDIRVVGSLRDFILVSEQRAAAIEKLASPETRIVSLTITEGGYYIQEGPDGFDARHPDIVHDLEHPDEPTCSFGIIMAALERRRRCGLAAFTLMSCDNIPGNGNVLRRNLAAFAELKDPGLARWMTAHCTFPNSMVDRITPKTLDEDRALIGERYGLDDRWPVVTERFSQWVVEDAFANGRPAWAKVGVQLTSDVAPYEKMKLRLLNASHQALCYIGLLLGHRFVHEAMGDRDIVQLVRTMMDREIGPLLPPVPGIDLPAYKRILIERFSDPAIRDQLLRIAIYGSSGLPKFVLPSIEEQLVRGGPITLLSFTIAAWFRYLTGLDDRARELPLTDPMGLRLRELARQGRADPTPLLDQSGIFSGSLRSAQRFRREVGAMLESFHQRGARATLVETLAEP